MALAMSTEPHSGLRVWKGGGVRRIRIAAAATAAPPRRRRRRRMRLATTTAAPQEVPPSQPRTADAFGVLGVAQDAHDDRAVVAVAVVPDRSHPLPPNVLVG